MMAPTNPEYDSRPDDIFCEEPFMEWPRPERKLSYDRWCRSTRQTRSHIRSFLCAYNISFN